MWTSEPSDSPGTAAGRPALTMLSRLLAFALFTGGALVMFLMVFFGVRAGRIRHSDSSSTYTLRKQPVRFGLVILVFSALGGVFLYAAIRTGLEIWRRL